MQNYCTPSVKQNIWIFAGLPLKVLCNLSQPFHKFSSDTSQQVSWSPGEILAFTMLCKCYYYSCFLEQNWNASISGAELESGSCKVTNGSYYSMLAAFGIINWSGVGAWHPSLHPHFPPGNSTPVKWAELLTWFHSHCMPLIGNTLRVYEWDQTSWASRSH